MKKTTQLLLLCGLVFLQSCCFYDDCGDEGPIVEPQSYSYDPVYMTRAQLEESIVLQEPKPIINSGKIYVINDLLFVNEKNEGFHVFFNGDPENPQPLNFISTPGGSDLSIKNGVYYVNQAVDLIAITFAARNSELQVSKRIRNVFPVMTSPEGQIAAEASEENIVVNWIPKN